MTHPRMPPSSQSYPAEVRFTVESILAHTRIDEHASGDYEPLVLSLQSPFPKEYEFALNSCMILSAAEETKELGVIRQLPALLNLLLAHAGFYNKEESGLLLRYLVEETLGVNFASFWEQLCIAEADEQEEDMEMLERQKERFRQCFVSILGLEEACHANVRRSSESDATASQMNTVGRRVHQVAHILRNFSFQLDNACVMAKNSTMLRFLVVTAFSNYGSLPQISYDIVSNIAQFLGAPATEASSAAVEELNTMLIELAICNVHFGSDRFKILRSLESLQGLGKEKSLARNKLIFEDKRLYERLFELVTLTQDMVLAVATLELILIATERGAQICKLIEEIPSSIGILVSFVSNGSSFFTTSCEGLNAEMDLSTPLATQKTVQDSDDAAPQILQLLPPSFQTCGPSVYSSQNVDSSLTHGNLKGVSNMMAYPVLLQVTSNTMITCPVAQTVNISNIMSTTTEKKNGYHRTYATLSSAATAVIKRNLLDGRLHEVVYLTHSKNGEFPNRALQNGLKMIHLDKNMMEQIAKVSAKTELKVRRPELDMDVAIPYLCEWDDCGARFLSAQKLRWHVDSIHCPRNGHKIVCKWGKRKGQRMAESCVMIRSRVSLRHHLRVLHYDDSKLEAALFRRRNPNSTREPQTTTVIQSARFRPTCKVSNAIPKVETPIEDSVTKSVRASAALALRNLAEKSISARKIIRRYEDSLVQVASDAYDCSDVLARLLFLIQFDDKNFVD